MKSAKWIKQKLEEVEKQLLEVQNQIEQKGIHPDDEKSLIETPFHFTTGKESNMSLDQRIMMLVSQKRILEDILKN